MPEPAAPHAHTAVPPSAARPVSQPAPPPVVRHLRQALLWPLRLVHAGVPAQAEQRRAPWVALQKAGPHNPWREHVDEYQAGGGRFHERHYQEFVGFLPYVQRFLYGEGRAQSGAGDASLGSPMRVFRRHDLAALRVQLQPGDAPLTLQVVHVDLYFFHGVDVVLLNVEVAIDELPLPVAQSLMHRFGRAYPSGWDAEGGPLHCLADVQWLGADGQVLARSDTREREAFMAHVAEHRAPRIAAHWEHVMAPLVNHHSAQAGTLRYRQIAYYRMPMMAYLALDEPQHLSPTDHMRLGLVTGADEGPAETGLAPESFTAFAQQHCYDRFWVGNGAAPHTRYLCSGLSLVVLGDARSTFYCCGERGVLAQFRHQHFLLFLIAHFQKAALLMMSDQLAEALTRLDITRPDSVRRFKRQIRLAYVAFLGFTHRYWFHEVSEQAHIKALFHLCTRHLQTDRVYDEVKDRIRDMNSYLDADALRRQASTVVRLTVVTIFGLVGTITTGFLGMNLLAEADRPFSHRVGVFALALVATTALTVYTIVKSKRLSDFLDVVSDERVSAWHKLGALAAVWRRQDD